MPAKNETNGLLHGTLDALVLKTLSRGARHGYGEAGGSFNDGSGWRDIRGGDARRGR